MKFNSKPPFTKEMETHYPRFIACGYMSILNLPIRVTFGDTFPPHEWSWNWSIGTGVQDQCAKELARIREFDIFKK